MVNTLLNEMLHRILGFLNASAYTEVDFDILSAMQVCKSWRILCFNILFHIDITRINRLATWIFLAHRIKAFRETCLECQKTTPKRKLKRQVKRKVPYSRPAANRVPEGLTRGEAQQQKKDRFVDQIKEWVGMEGNEHIWAARRRGYLWERHQAVLHCLA